MNQCTNFQVSYHFGNLRMSALTFCHCCGFLRPPVARSRILCFAVKKPPWVITYLEGVKTRLKIRCTFWGANFFLIKKPPWVITYPEGVKMRLKIRCTFWGANFFIIFFNKEAFLSYNLSRRSENEVENQVHILRSHFFK